PFWVIVEDNDGENSILKYSLTPEKWDAFLFIVDELHLLGSDKGHVLEVISYWHVEGAGTPFLLGGVEEETLKNTLKCGVGYLHEGLSELDQELNKQDAVDYLTWTKCVAIEEDIVLKPKEAHRDGSPIIECVLIVLADAIMFDRPVDALMPIEVEDDKDQWHNQVINQAQVLNILLNSWRLEEWCLMKMQDKLEESAFLNGYINDLVFGFKMTRLILIAQEFEMPMIKLHQGYAEEIWMDETKYKG
ncbi:hypothetical protein ACJX0J_032683, partial [Zea mays]